MRKLKTYLGRVIRDIARKIADREEMKELFANPLRTHPVKATV